MKIVRTKKNLKSHASLVANTRLDILLVTIFGLLIALTTWVWDIHIPYTSAFIKIPIVAALLTGAIIGSRRGALAALVSLAIIATGIIPFDGSPGGINRLYESFFTATLWDLPLAACITGMLFKHGHNRGLITIIIAILSGVTLPYLINITFWPIIYDLHWGRPNHYVTESVLESIFGNIAVSLLLISTIPQLVLKSIKTKNLIKK